MNNFPSEIEAEITEEEEQAVTFECTSVVRLDSAVAEFCDMSRSTAQTLIENGSVTIGEKIITQKSYKTKPGEIVKVVLPELRDCTALPENIPIDVVYEDDDLLVVNKPKGMVVHPAPGNPNGTLVNALLYHCKGQLSGINGVMRPGIVHRIDKNTSGLLVVAKTDRAHLSLSEQIKEHSVTREYRAVVYGHFKEDRGEINAPIGRHKIDRKKMCVTDKNSKSAVTHYEVLEEFKDFSYIRCVLETGRTHQIRVHMAYLGHPLAGDDVYGPKKVITELEGQCLHAMKLGFVHPITGEYMEFESALEEKFEKFLTKLRNIGK